MLTLNFLKSAELSISNTILVLCVIIIIAIVVNININKIIISRRINVIKCCSIYAM